MNQETAVAVQDAAKVVERRANIQVGNIDMPMLVRLRRLVKVGPFLRGLPLHFRSSPARLSTPHTLAGLTATMSASSIMNVSRR